MRPSPPGGRPSKLILASASPRRRELLSGAGVEYEAVVPDVDELCEGLAPSELVVENARRKAVAGLALADAGPQDVSLGVDTDVFLGGRALGKAATEEEAHERLQALSGRTHEVLSGVALARPGADGRETSTPLAKFDHRFAGTADDRLRTGVARSLVTFIDLDETAVSRYLASGEWRDRAGAYAIQGLGADLVGHLEGDFSNVVGLPLQLLADLAPELFPGISSDSAR